MTDLTKIREGMGVIDADDRCIGFARHLKRPGELQITRRRPAEMDCSFDHLIGMRIWPKAGRPATNEDMASTSGGVRFSESACAAQLRKPVRRPS